MSPFRTNLISRLNNIASKPNTSATTQLITDRRICRALVQRIDSLQTESRILKRKATKLKQSLPFTRHAIASMERLTAEYGRESQELCQLLGLIGAQLMADLEGLVDSLGFDRLCDVLSINPIHRDQARQEGKASIYSLAFYQRLEDSSERHGDAWGDGSPLFRACFHGWVMYAVDCCALGVDPFAPGEVFGPELPPKLRLVGK
ncbi:hypothetical protein [Pseudomonas akapageensis]|uniref:hypothetical protein n=1 Tax=Pseudomonas akapageensis TaxID=2609961 RepID=UPI00140CA05C|nr:hypothetical protein [Pseudomonas akapageensis]